MIDFYGNLQGVNDIPVLEIVHDLDFQFPSFDHLVRQFLAEFALLDGDVSAQTFVDVVQHLTESPGAQRDRFGSPR